MLYEQLAAIDFKAYIYSFKCIVVCDIRDMVELMV